MYHLSPIEYQQDKEYATLILSLAEDEKHQLADGSTDKFTQILQKYFQEKYQININCQYKLTELSKNSIAYQKEAEKNQALEQAKKILAEDPIIKKLTSSLPLELIESSIEIE